MRPDISFLKDNFTANGITIDDEGIDKFVDYYKMLVKYNEHINLTAITEWQDVVIKHFVDSLGLVHVFKGFTDMRDDLGGKALADVGTGAGFPGIPLKIAVPGIKLTLIDSLKKRIDFLEAVVRELDLKDVTCIHGRVEDLAHDDTYREQFDVVTSRAVASFNVLCEYCIPFVRKGGFFFPYKAEKTEEEIKAGETACNMLGGKIRDVIYFSPAGTDQQRSVIIVAKENLTDERYPRKAGKITKNPL